MKTWPLAVLLGVVPAFPAGAQPARPVIAVLESAPCKDDAPARSVRPLFGMTAGGWVPLSTAEVSRPFDLRDVTWTVAFDGRSLGTVHTIDPGFSSAYAWTYPRDRRLTVQGTPRPPVVANVKGAFGGWCASSKSRPLVLVIPANSADPDGWKPFRPTLGVRDRLFADFKKAVGKIDHCPDNSEKPVPFDYSAADVALVKGYRDRAGRMLVALQLNDGKYGCDGPAEDSWGPRWFLLSESVRSLGANLELVDAGDYDRDGKSEILFWYSGYNNDGYTLFYDGLVKRADFRWSYH